MKGDSECDGEGDGEGDGKGVGEGEGEGGYRRMSRFAERNSRRTIEGGSAGPARLAAPSSGRRASSAELGVLSGGGVPGLGV